MRVLVLVVPPRPEQVAHRARGLLAPRHLRDHASAPSCLTPPPSPGEPPPRALRSAASSTMRLPPARTSAMTSSAPLGTSRRHMRNVCRAGSSSHRPREGLSPPPRTRGKGRAGRGGRDGLRAAPTRPGTVVPTGPRPPPGARSKPLPRGTGAHRTTRWRPPGRRRNRPPGRAVVPVAPGLYPKTGSVTPPVPARAPRPGAPSPAHLPPSQRGMRRPPGQASTAISCTDRISCSHKN